MIKYWGDIVEKLAVGALVIALFQEKGNPWLAGIGLILFLLWVKLRFKETKERSPEK